jgi:hypothetical protein
VQVGNVFSIIDANDDGDITGAEFSDFAMGMRWGWVLKVEHQAAVLADKKSRFFTMDADNNGKVSEEELFAAGQKRYADADKDEDGKVTPWEFRAQRWL